MSFEHLRRTRWAQLATMFALAAGAGMGCSMDAESAAAVEEGDEQDAASTEVIHSAVKRQSIGNCWLYATVGWAESMHKTATGEELNVSESYLTYFSWFEQLANRYTYEGAPTEISTGGSWSYGTQLIRRYGVMLEKDFIPEEANAEMSARQASALATVNAGLKEGGALRSAVEKRDKAAIRRELDKAWGLSPEVVSALDTVFGTKVSRTLDKKFTTRKTGTAILRPQDLAAKLKNRSGTWKTVTLAEAVSGYGEYAWQEVDYPDYSDSSRRTMQKRVQKALADGMPVLMSWFVDFNALTSKGEFSLKQLQEKGPGRQGWHLTVLHDYQAENVPGFGTLKAGEKASPEALTAALDSSATITFFRIKNSWGSYRPDRWAEAAVAGYHDMYMDYLNGPVKKCEEKNGATDPTNCPSEVQPWRDIVLPAGY